VIGVARSADLVLIVVDAGSGKADRQKELLEFELERVGIRLNQKPPNVYYKRKVTGGVSVSSTCQLVNINELAVHQILHECAAYRSINRSIVYIYIYIHIYLCIYIYIYIYISLYIHVYIYIYIHIYIYTYR